VGDSRRFCVQCGQQLKPGSRFCVACGQPVPLQAPQEPQEPQDDPVPPTSPAWPSKSSYRPAGVTQPSKPSPPPPPDEFPPPPGQFPAPADQFPPPPGQYPPPPSQSPSRRSLVILALLLSAVIAAAVIFFVLRPSHPAQPGAGATPTSAGDQRSVGATTAAPSATPASSSAGISEQQAATNLAGLLKRSVADRSTITAAVTDVGQCGPSLNQDPQTFQRAAASRQQLLGQLSSLAGRSVLPAALLQSLTSAWQASAAADKDLGQWAQDELSNGCTQNDQADVNFKAAVGPDGQATTEKKAFVTQWNSIASKYGLTPYQWNQL
jgi:zinc-ribbon domain